MKPNRLRKSLRFSFLEGIFSSAMLGFTENFWVASAEALHVGALKAGMVSTLPNLVSSFVQTTAGALTEKLGGRLTFLKRVIVIQWFSLFFLVCLPLVSTQSRYLLLMSCAIFFAMGTSLSQPAWLSLMSSHLPSQSIGKYFGWRNRILGVISLICGLGAGCILEIFKSNVLWGFSCIFGLAFICRVVSWIFMIRMHDPRFRSRINGYEKLEDEIPSSFFKFIRSSHETHFVRFAFFVACFTFSVNVVAPYLAIYMLRDLRYSYPTFTCVTFAATITSIWGVKVWGEMADQFGNLRVIQATVLFIAAIPFLWFISGNPIWLTLVNSAAGFAWSGFQLCVMTYAFSEVPAAFRTRAIGYLSALNGMAMFLGSYLGGNLLHRLPQIGRSSFLGLFLISGLGRFLTVAYFLKKLREDRPAQFTSAFNLYTGALGLHAVFQSGKEILDIVFRKKKL